MKRLLISLLSLIRLVADAAAFDFHFGDSHKTTCGDNCIKMLYAAKRQAS